MIHMKTLMEFREKLYTLQWGLYLEIEQRECCRAEELRDFCMTKTPERVLGGMDLAKLLFKRVRSQSI